MPKQLGLLHFRQIGGNNFFDSGARFSRQFRNDLMSDLLAGGQIAAVRCVSPKQSRQGVADLLDQPPFLFQLNIVSLAPGGSPFAQGWRVIAACQVSQPITQSPVSFVGSCGNCLLRVYKL